MFSGGGEGFADGADAEGTDRFIAELQEGYTWLRRPGIVSVAAVHGHAIGAGFQLALACDIRVVADDAKFCMKEPALGLVPDLTGTKPLVEIVGIGRALELCLTARTVPAEEAARIGLAETLVPRDGLDAAVRDLVGALLAVNPGAAVATKRLLWEAAENSSTSSAPPSAASRSAGSASSSANDRWAGDAHAPGPSEIYLKDSAPPRASGSSTLLTPGRTVTSVPAG